MHKDVEIIACAFDPTTGILIGKPRPETIHKNNPLTKECETLTDVSEAYMRFWNRLPSVQKEMVLVQSIRWIT